MRVQSAPVVRTVASYIPNASLMGLRRLAGLPAEWRRRPHEADYLPFRSYLGHGAIVVDVGANRGQAVHSFRCVLQQPRIHSFEPNPRLATYVSTRFGSADVTVYPIALGERNGKESLFIPRYGSTVWDSRASLVAGEAEGFLTPSQFWRFDRRRGGIVEVEVTIRTLDEFRLAPHIVKVDVEGTEDAVIEGARGTIKRHRPIIMAEGSVVAAAERLGPLGYRRHRFDPAGWRFVAGTPGELNTFLMHPGHYPLFEGLDVVDT